MATKETVGAPIQRYSDPRLYGATLAKPWNQSYQWIRTIIHPLHPKCSLINECGIRAIKLVIGIVALAATAIPALIGRLIQIIHYHSLSPAYRENPPAISINGMKLPHLQPCQTPTKIKFHGTDEKSAVGILRWGFDPSRTAPESKMAEAIYVSENDAVSVEYGKDQLMLSLDLREEEVAYLSDNDLNAFKNDKNFSDKTTMAAVRQLFYQNGYRAIRYDLQCFGQEVAWAVYDSSCISITEIRPSPQAFRSQNENKSKPVALTS